MADFWVFIAQSLKICYFEKIGGKNTNSEFVLFVKNIIYLNLKMIRDESTNIIWKRRKKLVNLQEASQWASQYLNRTVTISNISYLLQYGSNGNSLINIEELKNYYDSFNKEKQWKKII
ncbi:MAG: hypothetical protein J7J73_02995 [Deltaproteobacteria bacterium]|nr:hypothetical protein [Deltaproteobacteria bacterium]